MTDIINKTCAARSGIGVVYHLVDDSRVLCTYCGRNYDTNTVQPAMHIEPALRCKRCKPWPDYRRRGDRTLMRHRGQS